MLIANLWQQFDAYNARHKSGKTVKFYRSRLRLFVARFADRDAGSITSLEVDEFLYDAGRRADGRELTSTTRRHNAVALTSLQSFAVEHKLIAAPWFAKLDKPRGRRRERVPTPEEFSKILAGGSAAFVLICTALAQCGARPGELCAAQISDIVFDDRPRIELTEHKTARKTGRKRIIPLGAQLLAIVKQAIGERTAGPVFLSPQGKAWDVSNLSSTFRKLRDKAGISRDVVLYHLRHRFATEALRAGVPIGDVSLLLGHADIATTQIYLHRDATEAAGGQDKVPGLDFGPQPPKTDQPPEN